MSLRNTVRARIDTDIIAALDKEAEARGVTLSWLVREILKEYAKSHRVDTVRIPAITFTGAGDEIGKAFQDEG